MSLLPSDIGDIYAGIRRHIYRYLMKYNDAVGGVLLAVSSLSFADGAREGRITDEMPHIHFDVKAKAQVFRPRAGHVLEGRVNKVGGWMMDCPVEDSNAHVLLWYEQRAVACGQGVYFKRYSMEASCQLQYLYGRDQDLPWVAACGKQKYKYGRLSF